jgi:hypothetical protein
MGWHNGHGYLSFGWALFGGKALTDLLPLPNITLRREFVGVSTSAFSPT